MVGYPEVRRFGSLPKTEVPAGCQSRRLRGWPGWGSPLAYVNFPFLRCPLAGGEQQGWRIGPAQEGGQTRLRRASSGAMMSIFQPGWSLAANSASGATRSAALGLPMIRSEWRSRGTIMTQRHNERPDVYHVELSHQRRIRRARSVFQRLALPTPVSISNGICSG